MIDVHTHCHGPEHWGAEWREHWQPRWGQDWPSPDPAGYDQAMADAGVQTAFVFGMRATATGVATPSQQVAEFCAATGTDTVGFMALDLTDSDLFEQLHEGVALGLRGVKLYPVLARFDPADSAHDAFYQRAAELGLIILWHMGGTVSPAGRLADSHPLVIDEVARRHPGLVQIIAHLGSPWHRSAIAVLRKNQSVFADVSGLWTRPYDAYAALGTAAEWGVAGQLLFGSDYPTFTPLQARQELDALAARSAPELAPVEPELIELIVGNDPRRALGSSSC